MNGGTYLVWISNLQGETTKSLSTITKQKRGAVGSGVQQTCWMCRLHETVKCKYKLTSTCERSVRCHCVSLFLRRVGGLLHVVKKKFQRKWCDKMWQKEEAAGVKYICLTHVISWFLCRFNMSLYVNMVLNMIPYFICIFPYREIFYHIWYHHTRTNNHYMKKNGGDHLYIWFPKMF